jgi:hypothetical protein
MRISQACSVLLPLRNVGILNLLKTVKGLLKAMTRHSRSYESESESQSESESESESE